MGIKFHLIGRVQGVGMRFYIQALARRYGLTGYVKNERDGSVRGVFFGPAKVLNLALDSLKKDHPGAIKEFHQTSFEDTASYDTFKITY